MESPDSTQTGFIVLTMPNFNHIIIQQLQEEQEEQEEDKEWEAISI